MRKHVSLKSFARSLAATITMACVMFPSFAYADEGQSFGGWSWLEVIVGVVLVVLGYLMLRKSRKQPKDDEDQNKPEIKRLGKGD